MDSADRISELPEFILHIILSLLDTKEACRSSTLNKKWYDAWSSIPVLDFQPQYFKGSSINTQYLYDMGTLERFMVYIAKTMERYSNQKHVIRKLHLSLPAFFESMKFLLDRWFGIAVENQVQELEIRILLEESIEYDLPEILFRARSLKILKCDRVKLSNISTMKLFSLEHLLLIKSTVDSDMLQCIISLCPLVVLEFKGCSAFGNVSIPCKTTMPENEVTLVNSSSVKVSCLRKFLYINHFQCPWPFKMNLAALRNLRELDFLDTDITDDIVSELTSGLALLESIQLIRCEPLKCVKISSISLKKIILVGCYNLEEAKIDAPDLRSFEFCVDLKLVPSITNVDFELRPFLSFTNVHDNCDGHCFIWVNSRSTEWFVKLKGFLIRTKNFKFLEMDMCSCDPDNPIVVDEDQLLVVNVNPPHKLREFKLCDTSEWTLEESSISSFFDLLFWSCRPDVLSMPTSFNNTNIELILSILNRKVRCWKHPLKSMEVEGVDHSGLLDSYQSTLEIRLKLSW